MIFGTKMTITLVYFPTETNKMVFSKVLWTQNGLYYRCLVFSNNAFLFNCRPFPFFPFFLAAAAGGGGDDNTKGTAVAEQKKKSKCSRDIFESFFSTRSA